MFIISVSNSVLPLQRGCLFADVLVDLASYRVVIKTTPLVIKVEYNINPFESHRKLKGLLICLKEDVPLRAAALPMAGGHLPF